MSGFIVSSPILINKFARNIATNINVGLGGR
ncbi:MAG: hypothetical protein ACD_51C00028G0035 [uncultured bacterium]|nr:MAG: hypothetical protein ACD_51C00028G0035 [uncultured bacterium]